MIRKSEEKRSLRGNPSVEKKKVLDGALPATTARQEVTIKAVAEEEGKIS